MKNRGFSLIEIVVAVAIMGILSGIVGLQLRSYIAKSKDTKAVVTLNTLRVAAQLYQVENEEALIDTASLTTYNEQKVKDALKKLEPYLDNNAKAIIEKPEMAIGGSRASKTGDVIFISLLLFSDSLWTKYDLPFSNIFFSCLKQKITTVSTPTRRMGMFTLNTTARRSIPAINIKRRPKPSLTFFREISKDWNLIHSLSDIADFSIFIICPLSFPKPLKNHIYFTCFFDNTQKKTIQKHWIVFISFGLAF